MRGRRKVKVRGKYGEGRIDAFGMKGKMVRGEGKGGVKAIQRGFIVRENK